MKDKIADQKKQIDNNQGNSTQMVQQLNDLNLLLKTAQGHLANLNEHQKQMSARLAALTDLEKYFKDEAQKAAKARNFYNKFVKPKGTK